MPRANQYERYQNDSRHSVGAGRGRYRRAVLPPSGGIATATPSALQID